MILDVRNNLAQQLGMNEKKSMKKTKLYRERITKTWSGVPSDSLSRETGDFRWKQWKRQSGLVCLQCQLTIRTYTVLQMLIADSRESKTNSHKKNRALWALSNRMNVWKTLTTGVSLLNFTQPGPWPPESGHWKQVQVHSDMIWRWR